MRLLSPEDVGRMDVESAFNPFRNINCFYHSESQQAIWEWAKE